MRERWGEGVTGRGRDGGNETRSKREGKQIWFGGRVKCENGVQ